MVDITNKTEVFKYGIDGGFIKKYESILSAAKDVGSNSGSLLRAIENEWNVKGFQWRIKPYEKIAPYNKEAKKARRLSIGDVFVSDKYGEYTVVEYSHSDRSYRKHYYVIFTNTGYKEEFNANTIMNGKAIDYMAPTVHGIGYLGARAKSNPRVSKTWRSMIRRCYGFHSSSHIYRNVEVCDRWLNFQNFAEDYRHIDGYSEYEFENGKLVLDKDLKQIDEVNKVYSLETCAFISSSENVSIRDKSNVPTKDFVALSPEGVFYKGSNVRAFCEKFGLLQSSVSRVVNSKKYTINGWVFGTEGMSEFDLRRIKNGEKIEKGA